MSLKRILSSCVVLAASIGFAVLPGTTPAMASDPVLISIDSLGGHFNAGQSAACGIDNSGTGGTKGAVWCWGDNTFGQIGDGTTTDANQPVRVVANPAIGFNNTEVTAVSVGNTSACALEGGVVFCWGSNFSGQLGNGSSSTPTNVVKVSDNQSFVNSNVSSISVGSMTACAIKGTVVYCWGSNGQGRLGINISPNSDPFRDKPEMVADNGGFVNGAISKVEVGYTHVCALRDGGSGNRKVYCWGANFNNQVDGSGTGSYTAATIAGSGSGFNNTDVSEISVGEAFSCAIESSKVYCWGGNGGSIGSGAPSVAPVLIPAASGFTNTAVTSVSAGALIACAVESSKAYCWGSVDRGAGANPPAGTGVALVASTSDFPNANVTDLDASPFGACGLENGKVSCWGLLPGQSVTAESTPVVLTWAQAPSTPTTTTLAPTTTVAPTTTTPSGGGAAPQLVTSANQGQLTQTAGGFTVIQNGSVVSATLTRVNASAASAAATPPAQRSADQVAELQVAGASLLAAFQASLPQGATSNVTVSNTTTGAVLRGLAQDASGNAVDVPVEDVLLITTPSSALLLAGVNATNAAANLSASGVLEIGPGGVINVAGSGLPNSGAAELVVMSTPRLLKSFTAGADGTFADRASLPSDLPAGNHTVVLAGSGIYMAVGITVGVTTLPTTGGDSSAVVVVALLVFALAAVLVRSRRLANNTR
jgi:alpha-tubulin suppressor-like RCC1 family protein